MSKQSKKRYPFVGTEFPRTSDSLIYIDPLVWLDACEQAEKITESIIHKFTLKSQGEKPEPCKK